MIETVAGFLNTDGGTLLIGIGPAYDYERVKPKNADGFANWLTTHRRNALGHTAVTRTRARIVVHESTEICHVDIAFSPNPVWAKTSKAEAVFYIRMNNSTRVVPDNEIDEYCAEHWGRNE